MVGVAQMAALTAKREIERMAGHGGQEGQGVQEVQGVHGALNAYKYVGFENQFRGSREVIRQRLESYVPYFEGTSDVLDVGCGRGEFLDLLASRGIKASGIDVNHEMVEECRARGLDASEADAVTYLAALPDAALGGLFAAQVVEHLEPSYLLRFLELAFHKLKPGGRLVLETLNPACWVAFFESYIRDITHRWPLHPETLKYLVLASGFTSAAIEWRSPVSEQDRLQSVRVPAQADPLSADLAEAFNANVAKLNARMFTHMDYAVVGAR
jgi:O-antigen chain-terminating methyltransferase